MKRRHFLRLVAAAGTGPSLLEPKSFARAHAVNNYASVALSKKAFGTTVSITACHAERSRAIAAIKAAFDELELVEQSMSLYRPDSQVSRLNHDGVVEDPHPYFLEALRFGQNVSRRTQGAFDLTVQPLWDLRRRVQREQRRPTDAEFNAALGQVGWSYLGFSPTRVAFQRRGMAATLNGIAQGLAADKAAAALLRHGIEHALIDAGELHPLGRNAAGFATTQEWTVGIQHPRRDDAYVAIARLAGRCLATSGDYATTFSDDFRDHHIIDPRRGVSPTELASVSVAAPTAMAADALSTALMVMGAEQGAALIGRMENVDALFVRKDGRTLKTGGFPLES
ncbi:MAG: FAD:protein FMN transferase [Planctomycetota bacterium]